MHSGMYAHFYESADTFAMHTLRQLWRFLLQLKVVASASRSLSPCRWPWSSPPTSVAGLGRAAEEPAFRALPHRAHRVSKRHCAHVYTCTPAWSRQCHVALLSLWNSRKATDGETHVDLVCEHIGGAHRQWCTCVPLSHCARTAAPY